LSSVDGVAGNADVTPFISVVTVSLNAAPTISDTLASVRLQRAGFAIEHICVDGGSKDGTRAIIDRWAAQSNRVIRVYEPDSGIFDAMNRGLREARGEYVLFLNADDFLAAPDALSIAFAGLIPDAQGNPDLIAGDVAMGVAGSRGLWRHRRVPRALGRIRGLGLFPIHPGQFTRRVLLQSIGGFDSTKRLASDVTQFYDLERSHRLSVRVVPRDVTCMHPGGAANANFRAMQLGTAEIYRHLRAIHGRIRSAAMVSVKTLQSVSELRYGRYPHQRWFDVCRN
jgi:glycosyltransferase involved in cell wall biosynthesis